MSGLHALLHRRAARPQPGGFRDAVVLSGGGSLGAAQVGALRALLESGVRPDLLVGCSVGALNAAFLAAHDNESVRMSHLLRAARSEYAKLEKTLTDSEVAGWV